MEKNGGERSRFGFAQLGEAMKCVGIGGMEMGCFSWLKADNLTKVANIVEGKPFKMLIPKEFGGGFIKDNYQGYGRIGTKEDGSPKYDLYELLAFWNAWMVTNHVTMTKVADKLQYDGDEFPLMKEIDQYTDKNRSVGISIECDLPKIDRLDYPLKLVSASYQGTYEECEGRSYLDPNQGWGALSRKEAEKHLKELRDFYYGKGE